MGAQRVGFSNVAACCYPLMAGMLIVWMEQLGSKPSENGRAKRPSRQAIGLI